VLIYPAIDLRGGKGVRLRQGDYAQETVFGDPVELARRWRDEGAEWLHLVDLDGAREGHPVNGPAIQAIIRESGLPCQLGGGLRQEEHLEQAFSWGVHRVILGTRALQDPRWCARLCQRHPGQVAIGIDARDGRVATEGWLQDSGRLALDLAREVASWSVAAIIYTDISRDGMLRGPNVEATIALARAVSVPVVASGGVTNLEDIAALARGKLSGCIVGRALYEGRLDLRQAISLANSSQSSVVSCQPEDKKPGNSLSD
jgi:phosphoribosylformimino-5-aminoimidazole carboxamide ribotide isomerase